MSYCRFSSDNWRSDVYVYEHYLGGIAIVVAANKIRGFAPPLIHLPYRYIVLDGEGTKLSRLRYHLVLRLFMLSHKIQMWYVRRAPRRNITLPYAGEQLTVETPREAIATLKALQALGYHVPERALRMLALEAEDAK